MKGQCPVCDGTFQVADSVETTEIINCKDCKNALEVLTVDKDNEIITVKEAPKVEEDWGE